MLKKMVLVAAACAPGVWADPSHAQTAIPDNVAAIQQAYQARMAAKRQQVMASLQNPMPVPVSPSAEAAQDARQAEMFRLVLLGKALLAERQYEAAERLFLQADQMEMADSGQHSASILTNLTRLYMEQGEWPKAEQNLLLQLQAYRHSQREDAFEVRYTKARLAETYLHLNKRDLATRTAYDSLFKKDLEQAGVEDLLLLAQVEQANTRYAKAEEFLKKTLTLLHKDADKTFMDEQAHAIALKRLAEVYTAWGKAGQATSAQQQADAFVEQLEEKLALQEICAMSSLLREEKRMQDARAAARYCIERGTDIYGPDDRFTQSMREMWPDISPKNAKHP